MIAKVRKEKGMSKTQLAKLTDINIGHLTHIEKGERNPSHKALKNISEIAKKNNIEINIIDYIYKIVFDNENPDILLNFINEKAS